MKAFNRRFEPSRILFLPPYCVAGLVGLLMASLMVFILADFIMVLAGSLLFMGSVFGIVFWVGVSQ